uniref:Uncharacterized protein n=1 Tax=viral metagenome TaxID=1070528 RepID=A0A6C0B700_9ZZZZ
MNCRFKLFNYDQQVCREAISKLHGSGSVVPKKVTGKYIYNLEANLIARNRKLGDKILIIADYNCLLDVNALLSQLQDLAFTAKFLDFRNNIGYNSNLIQLYEYSADVLSTDEDSLKKGKYGQIIIQYISSLIFDYGTPTGYLYYEGADLTIDNYSVVIIFTKKLPILYENDTYKPPFDQHTVDVNEYIPSLGYNLQNYIISGGNVIFGNNVWQTFSTTGSGIPNFGYSGVPFVRKNNYEYASDTYAVNEIKILNKLHPIFKNCGPILALAVPLVANKNPDFKKSVITNIVPDRDATVLATIADKELYNVPFLAINTNTNGGKTVGINSYLGAVSADNGGGNREFAKIIFNAIYWCAKINN